MSRGLVEGRTDRREGYCEPAGHPSQAGLYAVKEPLDRRGCRLIEPPFEECPAVQAGQGQGVVPDVCHRNGDTFLVGSNRALADRKRVGASALDGPCKVGSAHTRPAPRLPHDLHDQRLLAARFAEPKLNDSHCLLPSHCVNAGNMEAAETLRVSQRTGTSNPQSVPADLGLRSWFRDASAWTVAGAFRHSGRGAAGNPAERFGDQVVQIQGAADSGSPRNPWVSWGGEHRSERIQHPGSPRSLLRGVDTRSEERRSLLGGPRLRGMARGRWAASGVPTKPASWGG